MLFYTQDYLAHHGVLGQKWGIRRYQNKDGSLTSEGKKRYSEAVEKETHSLNYLSKSFYGNNKNFINSYNKVVERNNKTNIQKYNDIWNKRMKNVPENKRYYVKGYMELYDKIFSMNVQNQMAKDFMKNNMNLAVPIKELIDEYGDENLSTLSSRESAKFIRELFTALNSRDEDYYNEKYLNKEWDKYN